MAIEVPPFGHRGTSFWRHRYLFLAIEVHLFGDRGTLDNDDSARCLSWRTYDRAWVSSPGQSTSVFRRPGRHRVHQMRSAVRCLAGTIKGGLHPINNHLEGGFRHLLRAFLHKDDSFKAVAFSGVAKSRDSNMYAVYLSHGCLSIYTLHDIIPTAPGGGQFSTATD